MLMNIFYSTSIITLSGLSVGTTFLIFSDLYNLHIARRSFNKMSNIPQVFNTGFYLGAIAGLMYIIKERALLE